MRQISKIRKRDKEELDEEESLLDVYRRALGMSPEPSAQTRAAEWPSSRPRASPPW
jgi:hypothetical protein